MAAPFISTQTRRLSDAELDGWFRSGAWRELPGSSLPAMPPLATELLELASDPDVAQGRVATAVAKDPVLATRVLGFANSAAMASVVTVTSINEAILRLGTRRVCNIALADRMASGFSDTRVYGDLGRSLRDHSIGAAYVAYLIADGARVPADEAFLFGLLHDIGKLYVLKLVHDRGQPVPAGVIGPRRLALVADMHAEVGAHLVREWGLPERLHDPVAWHHEPSQATRDPRAASVAYTANRLAHRYGFGVPRDEAWDALADSEVHELGIDEAKLAHLDARAPGLFEVARKSLG
jgi:putative nucleotidyltransferase with HDIG domain